MTRPVCFGAILQIQNFITDAAKRASEMSGVSITKKQEQFLVLCLSSMLLCGHLMFTSVSLQCLGLFSVAALSRMFRESKIPFDELIKAVVCILFEIYGPTKAFIVIDDTDRARCKVVKSLGFVFKTICKITGGYILAQNVVFVCIVTDRFTIPIAFAFYFPDLAIKKWEKEIKALKKEKIHKKDHPKKPERNPKFPTRIAMCKPLLVRALAIINDIESHLLISKRPYIRLKIYATVADAAYMSPDLCEEIRQFFKFKVNFISQLKSNQLCSIRNKNKSLEKYFSSQVKQTTEFEIRGKIIKIEWASSRLQIKSHGCRLHVISLRYEGEKNWRYVAATDLTWRSEDIIKGYGLRWLVETFNEDWKQYGGWGKKAFQQGEEGCSRGVILSLLLDYFYLWHPLQVGLHRSAQPLCTVGSLVEHIQIEHIFTAIETSLEQPDPKAHIKQIKDCVDKLFVLRSSRKHSAGGAGFAYPEIEISPSLLQRFGRENRRQSG